MYYILFKFLKHPLFLLVYVLMSHTLFGQETRAIDSLKNLVETTHGTERSDAFYELTFEYLVLGDYKKALENVEYAREVAIQIGDSLRMVKCGRVRSQMLRRLDRTSDAISQFQEVLPIARRQGFVAEVKYILNGLGIAYTWQSNFDAALKCHFEVLLIREKEGDTKEIYETLNNIGLVYFKLKDYEKALNYYFRALEYEKKIDDKGGEPTLLNNIGLCYNQLQNYIEARKFFDEAIALCSPDCGDPFIIESQFGMGVSYFIEAEAKRDNEIYFPSKGCFKRSYEAAKREDHKRWQLENLIYLARIYTRISKFDSALIVLQEAEFTAADTKYNLLRIETFRCFSILYNQTKEFQLAAKYQEKYIHLKDSIYSEDLIKKLSKVQTDYEEHVNIATIAANNIMIKQQRDLNISFAIIAMLAGLLILLFQRNTRTIKRVNVALSDAKNTIEEQNAKLQVLNTDLDTEVKLKTVDLEKANRSLQRVVEELDNFIYKTSHDIRGPLASLKGICNIALLDVRDETALGYLVKLDITAEKLNTILTRLLIVNQINNSSLKIDEPVNFESVVADVLMLEKKKGLPPRLKIRKYIEPNLEFFSDREFVRIILENLIDNAIKFFNDSERIDPFVEIRISKEGKAIMIRVIDNGIGISEIHPDKIFQMFSRASERSETGGIGLFITKTATEKLGGSVSLKTTPEGYTEFFVKFAIENQGWQKRQNAV